MLLDCLDQIRYNQSMNFETPPMGNSQEQILQEKEQKWQEKLKGVEQLADKLGLGVDGGIKETVAAFHVFEINTTSSHEGKIDRNPVPYIDVESADVEELDRKLDEVETNNQTDASEEQSIRDKIFKRNLEERKKVITLLEEFYTERKVPYEVRLNIHPMARGWSRIQSQGADFQEVEQDQEKVKERLQQFQGEMRAFTEFLKNKYFGAE